MTESSQRLTIHGRPPAGFPGNAGAHLMPGAAEPGAAAPGAAAPGAGLGQPVIEVSGLEKRYGRKQVLRGVDFSVHQGEVFCLLGPNGVGKTTTIEILEGFRAASAGTARVLGLHPSAQELRARIGVVLQECGFPRHMKVGELLKAWRMYYPRSLPQAYLLEVVELTAEEDSLVRRLSGGQRRRLDFALALAGDPDLIFLDEPTTGFDPEARRRCWIVIENLRSLGKTIILTTHYLDEAERLADRVAILAEGRVAQIGAPRELAIRSGAPTTISFVPPAPLRRGDVVLPDHLRLAPESGPGSVPRADTRVEITSDDPWTDVRVLLDWAERNRLGPLADFSVAPPSLEEAYLYQFGAEQLSGRAAAPEPGDPEDKEVAG
jgi:ABC-2 type transport system ATP-binding protein